MIAPFLMATDPITDKSIYIRLDIITGFEFCWEANTKVPCIRTLKDSTRVKETPDILIERYTALVQKLKSAEPPSPMESLFASLNKEGH